MNSVCEIIEALGGPTEFGRICGFTRHPGARGSDMRQRRSIPMRYWARVIEAAQARGKDLTTDALVKIHAEQSRVAPQQDGAAA